MNNNSFNPTGSQRSIVGKKPVGAQQNNNRRAASQAARAARIAARAANAATPNNLVNAARANVAAVNANAATTPAAVNATNQAVNATNLAVNNPTPTNNSNAARSNLVAANANVNAAAAFGPATRRNTLAQQLTNAQRSKNTYAAVNFAGLSTPRNKYTNIGTGLIDRIDRIGEQIQSSTNLSNSNIDSISENLDNFIDEILKARAEFSTDLSARLSNTLKRSNGTYKTYAYNANGVLNVPANNTLESALKATTNTIKNYTNIINAQKFNSNFTNTGGPVFPAIMAMDQILLNYNSSAARVKAVQTVNLGKLQADIDGITAAIATNKSNSQRKHVNRLLNRLKTIRKAVNGK